MAMSLSEVTAWAGEHPYATGGIVLGGGLVLLWAFGFFSGSGGGGGAQTSGAAAFYGAEAAQAQIGGAIQIATLQTAAATNQAGIAAQNDQALANIQATAAVVLNGQNGASSGNLAQIQATNAVDLANIGAFSAGDLARVQAGSAADLANIASGTSIGLANIGAGVSNHLADTQYLATLNNNATTLAGIANNNQTRLVEDQISGQVQAAHDASLLQQGGQQLDALRESDQAAFLRGVQLYYTAHPP
jgi:hypothetical protein